ncbi:hypothetical protein L0222_03430 [bacterium]|nr:hypothetical protein [bacterium]
MVRGRRKFLFGSFGLIVLGAGSARFAKNPILRKLATLNDNSRALFSEAPGFDGDCVLTSDATDGPYFVKSPMRQDIREDRQGKEIMLRLKIANVANCKPVEGATVEIWHCDAEGAYSGYPEELAHDLWGTARFIHFSDAHVEPINEKRYLRGAQVTDANGVCKFMTIVPGWYEGRCPHIHFKVFAGGKDVFTSQFYFNESLTSRVYTSIEPYLRHGDSPYTIKNDGVIAQSKEHRGVLLNPEWSSSGPVMATAKIGLNLT